MASTRPRSPSSHPLSPGHLPRAVCLAASPGRGQTPPVYQSVSRLKIALWISQSVIQTREMFRDFSVLSMLSTIQAVKLQSAANSTPQPPPPAAPPPVEPPSPPDQSNEGGGASSGNQQHHSDMSRRKQKNPKPFFTSSADQEGDNEDEAALAVSEDNAENR